MQLMLALASIAASLVALPMQGEPSPQSEPSDQGAPAEPEGEPDGRVCRPMPPPTGSRLGATQRCGTRAQWRDWEINKTYARRSIERIQIERVCRDNDCR